MKLPIKLHLLKPYSRTALRRLSAIPDHRPQPIPVSLQYFNHIKATTKPTTNSLYFTFQALAKHVVYDPYNISELLSASKDWKSNESAEFLINRFVMGGKLVELSKVPVLIDDHSTRNKVLNWAIRELFNSDWKDVGVDLIDEMLKPGCFSEFPLDKNTVNTVFSNGCVHGLKGDNLHRLISCLGKHGVFPNSSQLETFCRQLCQSGSCDRAWDIVHELIEMGAEVDSSAFNSLLLASYGGQGFLDKMDWLMEKIMVKRIRLNEMSLGIYVKSLCEFRSVDDALLAFEEMIGDEIGIEPDVNVYNMLIDELCKVGRSDEGLELLERMNSEGGKCEPNEITYNSLIEAYCKNDDLKKGLELFEQMEGECVEFTDEEDNSAAYLLGETRANRLKGMASTYTNLITALCRRPNKMDMAVKMFKKMLKKGCPGDAVMHNSLISALSRARRMEDASFVLRKMKRAGFRLDAANYNALINEGCRKNKFHEVVQLLKDMKEDGLNPNTATSNTLVKFFCFMGELSKARKMFEMLDNDDLARAYVALIRAHCSNDDVDKAMELYIGMASSSKVMPDIDTYDCLIDSLCKQGKVEIALSLIYEIKHKGITPNIATYNAVFKALRQKNLLKEALKLRKQMTEQACLGDNTTTNIFEEWLSKAGLEHNYGSSYSQA